MQNILRILRHVVFVLVVICNAIITTVAVWNQSLNAAPNPAVSIDLYLICLGALGLIFILVILFLELSGKDSFTGTVRFECSWISTSFVMYLAGASVLSAIAPRQLCLSSSNLTPDACNSTKTLIAFSWIITFIFLIYWITLVSFVLLLRGEHPTIWSLRVRHLPSPSPKSILSSEPPSPVLPRFASIRVPPTIVAPIPRQMRASSGILYSHNLGLGLEYATEPYEPQVPPVSLPVQVVEIANVQQPHASLYPQHIQTTMRNTPEVQVHPELNTSRQHPPSPPPLGAWPRPNALTQPARSKRTRRANSLPILNNTSTSRPLGPRSMPTGRKEQPISDQG